jgi:hypothetical protein
MPTQAMTAAEAAYTFIFPDAEGTTYAEARRHLVSADAAELTQVIIDKTGSSPEGAQALADALI